MDQTITKQNSNNIKRIVNEYYSFFNPIINIGDKMLYYINSLYLYSLFGFILESTIYKIKKSKRHSSIFYGPITMVYGFGILLLLIAKKYFLDKLNIKRTQKLIITFLTCTIILTLTEWLGGTILNKIFQIDMWNYSKKTYHLGKYICLDLGLTWGFLGTLYIYYIKDYTDKIINIIPKKLTFVFVLLNLIDTIFVLYNKIPNW